MSSATLQRLEKLLSRVQERRAGPGAAAPVRAEARTTQAHEQPYSTPPPNTGRVSKTPAPTPLEESMEMLVPVERPRETQPNAFETKPAELPDSGELFLDDFEPPPTIAPPAMARAAAPARPAAPAPAPAAVAPAAAPVAAAAPAPARPEPAPMAAPAPVRPEPAPMAAPAPITSATARIATAAPTASASPVTAVSKARSIEPKSFGELLDLSLALRPAK